MNLVEQELVFLSVEQPASQSVAVGPPRKPFVMTIVRVDIPSLFKGWSVLFTYDEGMCGLQPEQYLGV